jgi:hypothetical protein
VPILEWPHLRLSGPATLPALQPAVSLTAFILYACMMRVGRHFLQLFPKVNSFLFSVILRSVAAFSFQFNTAAMSCSVQAILASQMAVSTAAQIVNLDYTLSKEGFES